MSGPAPETWLDGGVRTWSIPLDEAQWRALVRLRPRMTLVFLLAAGPASLGPMLDFRDSLGRDRPMARIDRLGGALQVYMSYMWHPAGPTFHERAVRGSDRFTAGYLFELDRNEFGPEEFKLSATEEGQFLHIRESQDPRTIQRLVDAIGIPVPPGLARRMQRRPPEIPWTALRTPWPRFARWLDGRRPRVERAVFRRKSIPVETIARLVDLGAELVLDNRGMEVTVEGKAQVAPVMEALGPCPTSFMAEMRPGDARRGSAHGGRLKGTDKEVVYDRYTLSGEWKSGRLTLWVGEEGADWGPLTRGLEAEKG